MNRCVNTMCNYNIFNKKDFLLWALKGGHPNKGGSTNLFATISDCNDKKVYCPATRRRKISPIVPKTPKNYKKQKSTPKTRKSTPKKNTPLKKSSVKK